MSADEGLSQSIVLPGELRQEPVAPSPPVSTRLDGGGGVSNRFQQLLQDLHDEHVAVTATLREELRVAKGSSQLGFLCHQELHDKHAAVTATLREEVAKGSSQVGSVEQGQVSPTLLFEAPQGTQVARQVSPTLPFEAQQGAQVARSDEASSTRSASKTPSTISDAAPAGKGGKGIKSVRLNLDENLPAQLPGQAQEVSDDESLRRQKSPTAGNEVTEVSDDAPHELIVLILGISRPLGANDKQTDQETLDTFCTCHWQSNPQLQWRTPTAVASSQPSWNHCIVMKEYPPGEELSFVVHRADGTHNTVLGTASLSSSLFSARGFEGPLLLRGAKGWTGAELDVKISVRSVISHAPDTENESKKIWEHGKELCNAPQQKWAALVTSLLENSMAEIHKPRPVWMSCKVNANNKGSAKQMKTKLSRIEETFGLASMGHTRSGGVFLGDSVRSEWESESEFERPSRCVAMDPHSPKRLLWAVLGMLFILYDFVMVPMQTFNLPESTFLEVLKWTGQIFWTLDIAVNFFTAVYVKSHLNHDLMVVARVYATTWLAFDVLVTLPTYLPLFIGEEAGDGGVTQGLRAMRVLRFMRLLRLAKFRHLLQEALQVINSPSLLLGMGMFQELLGLILWNHVVACIWHFIGQMGYHGWTGVESMVEGDIVYRYLSALHWVLSQYQGTSEIIPVSLAERAYAVAFLQVAIIILALFLSTLTNLMRQLQDLHQEKHKLQRSVRAYLNDNKISKGLSVRVKKYMDWQQRIEQRRRQDERILLILPDSLLMDLMVEVRLPVVAHHAFFNIFCKEFARICRRFVHEAMSNVSPAPNETVFAPGDTCSKMYWISRGELRYYARVGQVGSLVRDSIGMVTKQPTDAAMVRQPTDSLAFDSLFPGSSSCDLGEELTAEEQEQLSDRVSDGAWLSEAVMWTEWEHCGELIGVEECLLISLDNLRFSEIVKGYRPALIMVSIYARRFVGALQQSKHKYTDLIDNESLFAHFDVGNTTKREHSSFMSAVSRDVSVVGDMNFNSKGSVHHALVGLAQNFFTGDKQRRAVSDRQKKTIISFGTGKSASMLF